MFSSPEQLDAQRANDFYRDSLDSARRVARNELNKQYRECGRSLVTMEFHSTDSRAVETVAAELARDGWSVVRRDIRTGSFSHYLEVTPSR